LHQSFSGGVYALIKTLVSFLLLFVLLIPACNDTKNAVDTEVAVIETDYGRIVFEFYPQDAPKHVANFKKLAREGFYDGTAFHRVDPQLGIIQGGDPNSKTDDVNTWGMGQPGQPTVPAEFNDRKHVRGTVAAARKGNDINSADSQFYICNKSQPAFDNQYTIFGNVIEGMNVVDIICNAPVVPNTTRPVEKVVMKKVYIINRDQLK